LSSVLQILYQLQSLDEKLHEKQQQIERYEAELALRRRRMEECNAEIERLTAARKQLVNDRALTERAVSDQQEQLRDRRARLNRVRTERELRASEYETRALAEEIDAEEEKLLGLMGRVEEIESEIEQRKQEYRELQEADHVHVAEAAERIEALRAEVAGQRAERETLARDVDAPIRKHYNMVLTRRGGPVVVTVVGGSCGGCYMRVPPQTLNEIMRTGKVHVCPSCQRILYVEPPAE
jgi:predicted  nucleic acid-binding Zn-ribbon protein